MLDCGEVYGDSEVAQDKLIMLTSKPAVELAHESSLGEEARRVGSIFYAPSSSRFSPHFLQKPTLPWDPGAL